MHKKQNYITNFFVATNYMKNTKNILKYVYFDMILPSSIVPLSSPCCRPAPMKAKKMKVKGSRNVIGTFSEGCRTFLPQTFNPKLQHQTF